MKKEQIVNVLIKSTLESYKNQEITNGFITNDNIELVTNGLGLKELSNEELSEMWEQVDEYFLAQYAVFENGKVVGWKPYTNEVEFARDTKSAWLEVINLEARKRKRLGLL